MNFIYGKDMPRWDSLVFIQWALLWKKHSQMILPRHWFVNWLQLCYYDIMLFTFSTQSIFTTLSYLLHIASSAFSKWRWRMYFSHPISIFLGQSINLEVKNHKVVCKVLFICDGIWWKSVMCAENFLQNRTSWLGSKSCLKAKLGVPCHVPAYVF